MTAPGIPIRRPILLGPGGGRAFPSFASFVKPKPSAIIRIGGRALSLGGRALGAIIRVGGRALPVIGWAMWAYDAYTLYQWWNNPCK